MKSPEHELVDDLMAIMTSFSGRLYGMRSRKQTELLMCAKQVMETQEDD
jgi:putative resolvase